MIWKPRRRCALTFTAGLALAVMLSSAAETHASEGPAPREPVEALYAALLDVMQRADELGFTGRYAQLEPVVASAYDTPFMAAKTLGRHWKKLSAEERERWVALFQRLTVSTYADRFDGFSGERFELERDEPAAGGTSLVHTRIVRTKDEPVEIDYRVRRLEDGYHIVDVYLNGTVSELALRRADYSSLLKRKGFDALVAAVEEKIAAAESDAGTSP